MEKQGELNATSVEVDREYERNVDLSIQWSRWLLKMLGVWPMFGKSTRIGKCFSCLINLTCFCVISFLFVPCALFFVVEVKDLYNKIRLIGPLSFFVMSYMKYYLLILHDNDIRECVERIKWDWKCTRYIEDRNVMVVYANYGRKLIAICTSIVYCSFTFFYLVIPLTAGRIVAEGGNLTFISLAFPFAKLIADVRYSPANEIVYFIQLLTGFVLNLITPAACSLAIVFAVHACGQMQILMNWLEHLVDGRSDMSNVVDDRIASTVNQHVRILKFLSLTEKALQQISFVEFVGCIVNLCLLGYYTIMEWNPREITFSVTYMILLASFTFNIFIFCYIGELVAEQCKKVGETVYMIKWYQLPGNKKLCCILIIAMSNSSVKFTAGNMVELSINTFSDVLRTSVAFLNMLRATT